MRFSEKLVKQRKNSNLSQEQLADKLHVSRQSVSKWESGLSYPDMEKIISMCKIFNCSLDELIDDDACGNKKIANNKNYLEEVLSFITDTVNMFFSMSFKDKFKCLFEQLFIIMTFTIGYEIFNFFSRNIINSLLRLIIGYGNYYHYVSFIPDTIYLVFVLIVMIHLFKKRYLDYYITVYDDNIKEKIIEKPIKENDLKIIIRDPNKDYNFLKILWYVILLGIKLLLGGFTISFAIFLIIAIISIVLTSLMIFDSIIFLYLSFILLAVIIALFEAIRIMYNIIINKKNNYVFSFYIFVLSILIFGLMSGFMVNSISKFEFIPDKVETYELEFNDKGFIYPHIEYIIDNNRNNLLITYTNNTFDLKDPFIYYCFTNNYCGIYRSNYNNANYLYVIKKFITEKKFINIDNSYKIKSITLNEKHYNILNNNK